MSVCSFDSFQICHATSVKLDGQGKCTHCNKREKITVYRRISDNRVYIEIAQHQNSISKVLPNMNYCMCAEFRNSVIGSSELYTCSHVLGFLLNKIKIETCGDDAFVFSLQIIQPVSTTVAAQGTA